MQTFLKILSFVAIVAVGAFTASLVLVLSLKFGIIDALPQDEHMNAFSKTYFGGGGMICIIATLLGLASFYVEGKTKAFLKTLPITAPLVYAVSVLAYFSNL